MVKVSKHNKEIVGSNPTGATFIRDLSFDTLITVAKHNRLTQH
jgi:hypothetical protein